MCGGGGGWFDQTAKGELEEGELMADFHVRVLSGGGGGGNGGVGGMERSLTARVIEEILAIADVSERERETRKKFENKKKGMGRECMEEGFLRRGLGRN